MPAETGASGGPAMPRMVTFRLNRECRDIAVNTDRILYVAPYETGASSVHFSKECFLRVQGEIKDVIRRIESVTDEDATRETGPCSDERREATSLS